MLEILQYVLGNFWRCVGFLFILAIIAEVPIRIVAAIVSRGRTEIKKEEK